MIMPTSAVANELSRQWAVHHSTAHRLDIRRALRLRPSNNKYSPMIMPTSAAANELSRQWAVRHSTAHRLEIRRALHLLPYNIDGCWLWWGNMS